MDPRCDIDECPNPPLSRGMCGKHYARWRKHGDPSRVDAPGRTRIGGECSVEGCSERARARGYCDPHYNKWRKYGDPTRSKPTTQERFWAKVDKSGECWRWTGTRTQDGYGRMRVGDFKAAVHRLAWEWAKGEIPTGLQINHKCHTRDCVRVSHLETATPLENSDDRLGANSGNRSRYRGVTWYRQVQKWRGRVMHRGVSYECGNFDDPAEAFAAVQAKRAELGLPVRGIS